MFNQPHHLLKTSVVCRLLDGHHLTHGDFAAKIQLSRNYWSQLLNRRRSLTPRVRRALLAELAPMTASELWDTIEPATGAA